MSLPHRGSARRRKPFLTAPADRGPTPRSPAASLPGCAPSQACRFPCLHGHPMGKRHWFELPQLNLTRACWAFLSLLEIKTENIKTQIYVHNPCSAAALLGSAMLPAGLDPAGCAALLPSERLVLGSCSSSGKVSLGEKKKIKKGDKSCGLLALKISLQPWFLP